MSKKAKPKVNKTERSSRPNGKAPKKNPKSNKPATGRTVAGFSPAAMARRAAVREPLTLAGLSGPSARTKTRK